MAGGKGDKVFLHGMDDSRGNNLQEQQERKLGIMFVPGGTFMHGFETFSPDVENFRGNSGDHRPPKKANLERLRRSHEYQVHPVQASQDNQDIQSIPPPHDSQAVVAHLAKQLKSISTEGRDAGLMTVGEVQQARETHENENPSKLQYLIEFDQQISKEREKKHINPNNVHFVDMPLAKQRNIDTIKFNNLLNELEKSGVHTGLQPKELIRLDDVAGGADETSNSNGEYNYEKDRLRTIQKESRERTIASLREKYEAAVEKFEEYTTQYGKTKYKISQEEIEELTQGHNEYNISTQIKYDFMSVNGILYDFDDKNRKKRDFEKIKDQIDNMYIKVLERRIKTYEKLADNLDTENPPSSIEETSSEE